MNERKAELKLSMVIILKYLEIFRGLSRFGANEKVDGQLWQKGTSQSLITLLGETSGSRLEVGQHYLRKCLPFFLPNRHWAGSLQEELEHQDYFALALHCTRTTFALR